MDDVEALSTIVGVLRKQDEEAQLRVLSSVEAFLGLPPRHRVGSVRVEEMVSTSVAAPASQFSQDRTMSAKEFLRDKQPGSDVERVACLAYYLTHYRETPHFKTVDISSLNIEAAQPKFANASAAVDNARARGMLVPSTNGNKQLSALGEKYVELLPDREAAKASMVIRAKRSVKKAKFRKSG